MLKRFCNKCKKEIPEKTFFYRFTIEQVSWVPFNKCSEAVKEAGTVDCCVDCFDELLEIAGGNNEIHS